MAETTFISSGPIVNDVPQDGASNPWECHDFVYQMLYTEGTLFDSHISWEVSGYLPVGLAIDNITGIISGNIEPLNYQYPEIVTDIGVKEKLLIDGSNYNNIGRPKSATYVFTFNVKRTYNIKTDPDLLLADPTLPLTEIETNNTDLSLTVIKNNDVDNTVFIIEYLSGVSSIVNDIEVLHTIEVNGTTYDSNTIEECLAAHPGPFGKCSVS